MDVALLREPLLVLPKVVTKGVILAKHLRIATLVLVVGIGSRNCAVHLAQELLHFRWIKVRVSESLLRHATVIRKLCFLVRILMFVVLEKRLMERLSLIIITC